MLRECGQPKARREYPDSQQRIKKESFICVLASSIVPDPVLLRFSFSLFSSRVLICMYKTLLALLPWPVFFSFSHLIKDEAFLPPPPKSHPPNQNPSEATPILGCKMKGCLVVIISRSVVGRREGDMMMTSYPQRAPTSTLAPAADPCHVVSCARQKTQR